ncbi:MAG: hypothetical protein ACLUQ6_11135 [Alistipes onderdonkii]
MELQRAIDSLLKWMHRYVSPVFLALLMASFILWYIAKLSYIYTTEQKVRVDVDGQVFDVTCTVEGVGTNLFRLPGLHEQDAAHPALGAQVQALARGGARGADHHRSAVVAECDFREIQRY